MDMMTEKLKKAREYEGKYARFISDEERPAYHLTPRIGWMNDPNGFSFYNGAYHLFYQYHPYSLEWGPMHWGHALSRDLLHWEYLPCALAPDQTYDGYGCFSGSASELPDGRQLLMYTGVREEMCEDGRKKTVQTQCMAVGDGLNYEKYEANPVLDETSLPAGGQPPGFPRSEAVERRGRLVRLYCGKPHRGWQRLFAAVPLRRRISLEF